MQASVTGLNEAIAYMRSMTASLKRPPLQHIVQGTLQNGADRLRAVTPVDSGETARSIRVVQDGNSFTMVARDPEISYLLRGTPRDDPGARIYPTSANVLRFIVGGRVIFARSVRGSKPNAAMNSVVDHITSSAVTDRISQQIGAMVVSGRGGE